MTQVKASVITMPESLLDFNAHALRQLSVEIDFSVMKKELLEAISKNLIYLCQTGHGVAIAAPQIGIPVRMVYVGDLKGKIENTILINPKITEVSGDIIVGDESCLCFPGRRGKVPRSDRIKLRYFDLNGKEFNIELEKFQSRVVQHEVDHLDGILYPDRAVGPLEEIEDLFWMSAEFKMSKMKV